MAAVLIFLFLGLGLLALGIYTIVDIARYPDCAFERAGTSKALWLVLSIVFMFVCGLVALIVDLVWLTSKRADVQRAAASGGYGTPGPPPGWVPPPTHPPAPQWGTTPPPMAPPASTAPPPPPSPSSEPPPQ